MIGTVIGWLYFSSRFKRYMKFQRVKLKISKINRTGKI